MESVSLSALADEGLAAARSSNSGRAAPATIISYARR